MQHVRESKIIAIVRGQAPEKMFSLAKALLEGGIDMMEITFNQSDAQSWQGTAAAIRSIHDGLPEMYIGAGVGGNLVNHEWIEREEWGKCTALARAYVQAARG